MHGDPDTPVRGIAVTWLATDGVLKQAHETGLNFVVAHEGAFYPNFLGFESEKQHHAAKHALMDKLGLVLMRCHDTWDRMPDIGVRDVWASCLGFTPEPCDINSFYRVSRVNHLSVAEVAEKVCLQTRKYGQSTIRMMAADPQKKVQRLVTGTGAITELPDMHRLGADLIIATDDGIHTTYCALWSLDLDIPMIVVSHPVSEIPAMFTLADYIKQHFPTVPVHYVSCPPLCQEIS